MLYGYATHDIFPLLVTFIFGDIVSLAYIGVFYRWTTDRRYALRLVVSALLAVVITTIYVALGKSGHTNQSEGAVEDTAGWFTAAASVLLYLSPLATVRRVLQAKNSASIPLALCFAGMMENVFWCLYGALKGDVFMWGITAPCVLFALFQVILCFVYPPKPDQYHEMDDIEVAKMSRSSAGDYTLQSSPKSDMKQSIV